MPHLTINLLGTFQGSLDGVSLVDLKTNKNRALLAYLVVESGQPHRRNALAALLWPNHPEIQARGSLRQALFQVRQALGNRHKASAYLLLASDEVRFNPRSDYWLDVDEFQEHISACWSHHPHGSTLCECCQEHLKRAVALYRGEFMTGFSLPGCLNFDLWQIYTQEACHNRALQALSRLAHFYEIQHHYDQVVDYTQRKIELEPWLESAHRRRMRALALNGQRTEALLQYEACREILARELGVFPSRETVKLYEQIRYGNINELIHTEFSAGEHSSPQRLFGGEVRDRSSLFSEISHQSIREFLDRDSKKADSNLRQPVHDALYTLAWEIELLQAGEVLPEGSLRRLRTALLAILASIVGSQVSLSRGEKSVPPAA